MLVTLIKIQTNYCKIQGNKCKHLASFEDFDIAFHDSMTSTTFCLDMGFGGFLKLKRISDER